MPDFDPELYLRLLGERELVEGKNLSEAFRDLAALPEATAALRVSGVISSQLAREITTDYGVASLIRDESPMLEHRLQAASEAAADAPADPEPLIAQRSYGLSRSLEMPGGRLKMSVLLTTPHEGRLDVEYISDTDLQGSGAGPPPLSILLPSGQQVAASFRGGYGDRHAEGHFGFEADLRGALPWLEIAGHRVELGPPAPATLAEVEHLSQDGLPMRYLWQLLGDYNGDHNHSGLTNRAAPDALVRAGLIAADDPQLEAVLWVADARAGQGPRRLRHHRRASQPATPPTVPAAVPGPWRAVLSAPVTGPGPEGTIALAAATPVFNGFSVVVNALRSKPDNATLQVTVTDTMLSASGRVAWWAEDDRGNHYLGETGNWVGGAEGIRSGAIVLGPLHPKARSLTVTITGLSARAIIPISLDWPGTDTAPGTGTAP